MVHLGLLIPLDYYEYTFPGIKVQYAGGLELVFEGPDLGEKPSETYKKLSHIFYPSADNYATVIGKFTVADLGGDEARMLDETCDVFFPHAPGAQMSEQEKGFRKLVELYGRVKQYKEFTEELENKRKGVFGNELKVDETFWPSVERMMTGDGPFTPPKITQLAYDIYHAFRSLEGKPYASAPINNEQGAGCSDYPGGLFGFSYDLRLVPWFIRSEMYEVADMYLQGAKFLENYEKVECDGWGFDSCGGEEVWIENIGFLRKIKESDDPEDLKMPVCPRLR